MNEWMDDGACADSLVDYWNGAPSKSLEKEYTARAKEVCNQCPVQEACLEHGLRHVRWGILGGLTQKERNKLRKERDIKYKGLGRIQVGSRWDNEMTIGVEGL